MNKIIKFLLWPWNKWSSYRNYKKRIEELKKRDPFIYK